MNRVPAPHFSTADLGHIPTLETSLIEHNADMREVAEFKREFLEPGEYLDWLMKEVATQVYGVTDKVGPRRERGRGGRKAGAHSEGRHR